MYETAFLSSLLYSLQRTDNMRDIASLGFVVPYIEIMAHILDQKYLTQACKQAVHKA